MRDLPKRMMDATQDVARLVACLEDVQQALSAAPNDTYTEYRGLLMTLPELADVIDETLGENRG